MLDTWVVIGGGPSLTTEDVDFCRGKATVLVINDGYRMAPWADALYAADHRWWISAPVGFDLPHIELSRCVKRRICCDPGTCEMFGVEYVSHLPGIGLGDDGIVTGNMSGTSGINIAANEGAKRILLLGFDMRGKHWFGDHPDTVEIPTPHGEPRIEYMNTVTEDDFQYARDELSVMAAELRVRGIEVINCSRDTSLTCFPRATIQESLSMFPKTTKAAPAAPPALSITPERANEHRKYVEAYRNENYRMHGSRMENAQTDLVQLPARGSYLDVGCGRGTMLDFAESIGFTEVKGTEVVDYLVDGARVVRGEAHDLPFAAKSFDVVSSFDVIEHILPGDDELLCKELLRVARKHILISANNCSSCLATGEELHVNKRPYEEWDQLFREWFVGGVVTWIPTNHTHSTERWRVDL